MLGLGSPGRPDPGIGIFRGNEGIAEHFGITTGAIDTRCTSIFAKLGITNLAGPDKINRRVTAVVQYIKSLLGVKS